MDTLRFHKVGGDAFEHFRELREHADPLVASFGRLMTDLMPIIARWLDEERERGVPIPVRIQEIANVMTTFGATALLNTVRDEDRQRGFELLLKLVTDQMTYSLEHQMFADTPAGEAS